MNTHYFTNTSRVLGLLLMPFSATMLPPVLVALWYQEKAAYFLYATIATLLLGVVLWFPFRKHSRDIQAREAFLIVSLLWLVLSLMGALPLIFAGIPNFSKVDAIFEAISGLTTTGATTLTGLDALPHALLYYRQQLQFLGGGGIIVLGIAIFPMLGVGGMQLFRAEITGPFKEDKLTPRITQTSKALWLIYVGLVIICAFSYWHAGMSLFDAIGYSFSTISTGGFATHDQSFEYFNSPLLELLASLFMLLGAINFALHFSVIRRKSLLHLWHDPESRLYIIFLLCATILTCSTLLYYQHFDHIGTAFIKSFFQVTTFSTTTGFFSANYSNWPTYLPLFLVFISLIGGCAGSTAGGMKIIRLLVLKKQASREIKRLIHPNSHYVIKLGLSRLHHKTLDAILGFFTIFVLFFVLMLLVLLAMGLDFISAFSALSSAVSNTGIGLGVVTENFKTLSDPIKIVLSFAMIAGRLELFTVLILFTPNYWRY